MINNKVLKSLEYDKILETVASYAVLGYSKKALLSEVPVCDYLSVKHNLDKTCEAYNLYINGVKGVIYFDVLDDALERAKKLATLVPSELLSVARLLRSARITATEIFEFSENTSILRDIANQIFYDNYLENDIFSKIVNENEVADNASQKLYDLRKNIKRINERIRERLLSYMRAGANKYLQDNVVSMRNGRYVVPVKAEHVGSLKGFIHDRSQSGSTFFVEPQEILDLNNELRREMLAESVEVERILQELTQNVSAICNNLEKDVELLTDLDVCFAKAEYSYKVKGVYPKLNANGEISIVKGRHPLIDKEKVVPITISFGETYNFLLISGPNTGGKTVTLKLVGLFTLMAMSGLYVPSVEGTKLSVFDKIFCNIGDEQSIENSLSTFSSHVKNLVDILSGANSKSLVLIDEIGSGTDPEEGAVIAQAVLEELINLKSYGVITTHYSSLKEYALIASQIENASMDFDGETFAPLYKLNVGSPGTSNAIEISRRLGLDESVLLRAKSLLSSEKVALDNVLKQAEKSRVEAENLKTEIERIKNEEVKLYNELKSEREKFEKEREKFLVKAKAEARKLVNEKLENAEEMLAEMKEVFKKAEYTSSDYVKMATLKNKIENEKYSVEKGEETSVPYKPAIIEKLKVGDTVYLKSLNQNGEILEINKKGKTAWVLSGIVRINAKIADIFVISTNNSKKETPTVSIKRENQFEIKTELNVIGNNLDEALLKLDKFIDNAVLSNYEEIRVVHGKGQHVLSSGIHKSLKKDRRVDSYRFGKYGEGENGVTIIKIK
ncbi:MAG: endonuclease MutS2 [Clostridia bacterium]|nr:endonuclease MutS2 [Clostridia bacterium]